jgi:hypothetical protein
MTTACLAVAAVACAPPEVDPPGGGTTTTAGTGPTTPTTATSTTTTTTLPAPTTTLPDGTGLYSATPVSGWGILKEGAQDQYVDAVEISGNAVYVGGIFTHAVREAQTANRANLMAVELATGNLLPFVADTNGSVNAIASDGTSLYIGGTFTTVNGVPRSRLAKINLATSAVDPDFNPNVGNIVHDMVVVGGRLFLVGEFNSVNGVERRRAAAVNTTTGGVDMGFDPSVDGKVQAIAASPDGSVIYLGGNFTEVGTTSRQNLAKVNASTGAVLSPTFAQVNDLVEDLSVKSDGTHLYAGTKFNSAVDWNVSTGKREWAVRADGDMQAAQYSNGMVYAGFHDGFQGDTTLRLLALAPTNGAVDPSFHPTSNSYPGVYCLDADGRYLVAGGYFSNMGGVGVKGLAIFPKV